MLLKTWHIFRGVFSLAGMTLSVLILILEIKGLPDNFILGLRQELDSDTLKFEFGQIHLGPISGLKIKDASIRDLEYKEKDFFYAQLIDIKVNISDLTQSIISPESFEAKNLNINLPLHFQQKTQILQLINGNLKAKIKSHSHLSIEKFSCETDFLRITLQGEINNALTSSTKQTDSDLHIPNINEINNLIPHDIKEHLFKVNNLAKRLNLEDKINLVIDFKTDLLAPKEKTIIGLKLSFPDFIYYGNSIHTAIIELRVTKDHLQVDRIDVKANENESLSGNISYHLKEKTLAGKIDSRVFPFKYLKIFAPQIINDIDFIQFDESPPQLSLKLKPSKITELKSIKATGHIKAADLKIQGLTVDLVEGDFLVNDLNFISRTLKLTGPQLNGQVQVKYTSDNDKVALYAEASGDPRHVSNFIFSDVGRENYLAVWDRFTWNKNSPPTFSGYFDYMYDETIDEDTMHFTGDFKAIGAAINGIRTQNLSAKVNMKFPDYILISNIKVDTTNRHARGDLGFKNLNSNATIDYQFYSTLAIADSLQIVNDEWDGILDSLNLPDNSYVRITGHLPIDAPIEIRSEAYIELPHIKLMNMTIKDPILTLNLRNKKLNVATRKANFYAGNLHFLYQENLDSNRQSLKVTATNANLAGIIAETQKDALETAAGKVNFGVDLNLKSKKGEVVSILGNGYLNITDGLFLEIPFLSTFFKRLESILPFAKATQIKEISAQLNFYDQQIDIDKFYSDGSLVALSGNGWYDWGQNMYLFNINTHYLKGILTLPKPLNVDILQSLFSPLSVLVRGEVRGDSNGWNWTINSFKRFKEGVKNNSKGINDTFRSIDDR